MSLASIMIPIERSRRTFTLPEICSSSDLFIPNTDTSAISLGSSPPDMSLTPLTPMASLQVRPRIKISIRKKHTLTEEMLARPDKLDICDIVQACRAHQVIVRGDKEALCRALLKKVYGKQTPTQKSAGLLFARYFLCKLGLGGQFIASALMECQNDTDFITDVALTNIPKIFRFYVGLGSRSSYGFDIRSLNDYYQQSNVFLNPYTGLDFEEEDLKRFQKKVRWLTRFHYPVTHVLVKPATTLERRVVDVFHKVHMYYYVDYRWFTALSFEQLRHLYKEYADMWSERLSLSDETKNKIVDVRNGPLFSVNVHKYKHDMKDALSHCLLADIERLVSEGVTSEDRKTGALYSIYGLVQLSSGAAQHYPSLV